MTYIADIDPNGTPALRAEAALDAAESYDGPVEADPRYVDYSDVSDPEAGVVWGYGGDHRVYIPGASD